MNKLIEACLKYRVVVMILTVVAMCAGVYVIKTLPVDVFPELKVPRVTVQTEAAGLTAEEVEQYISIPLEGALTGATGVKSLRTSSGSGLAFAWVEFDWDQDIYRARQIVSERLSAARGSLPNEVESELAPIVSITGEIMLLSLTGDGTISPLDMRRTAEYALRNRLMAIPGVGQVTVLGGRLPEYQVLYDPERLVQAGVTLDQLRAAVESAQSTLPAGYLEDVAGQEIPLKQEARLQTIAQLERAIIPDHPSKVIRVGDVAKVEIGGAPRRGGASFKGQDAVVLSIQKAPGANTMEITQAVDKVVAEFIKSELPEGMTLRTDAYRQSNFIELSLHEGLNIIIQAAIVVLLVVLLTLLNVRTTLITLFSMPLSILLAFICFPMFDLAINIMTLGGLAVAVGDVVDNAIIFVEIAWRRLQENAARPKADQLNKLDVLKKATGEISGSITFSTLIILLVFCPLLFLSGIEGQFFKPLGITYMLVVFASLIVALMVTPVMCYFGFKVKKHHTASGTDVVDTAAEAETFSTKWIKKIYAPLLDFCIKRAKWVVSVMVALTGGALILASTFGTSFLPPFNEDCFTVFVSTVPGSSLKDTERISRQVMLDLENIPGVLSVTQRAGRAENDEHAEPVSASEMLVRFDLNHDPKEVKKQINEIIADIPGTSTLLGYPLAHRISSALSGDAAELAINIYGNDLPTLREASKKAQEIMKKIPEVADARANREIMVDTLDIKYRPEVIAAAGLTMAEVGEQVSAALNGLKLGEVVKNQDRWNIVMRLDDRIKQSIDDVKRLRIVAGKNTIPLSELADITREETSNMILRDNGRRKAMISVNPAANSNLGDVVEILREKLDPEMHKMGVTVEYDGTIKARESAASRLYWLTGGILVLMVVFLSASLGNVKYALLTLVNIPLCLIGGIIAVYLATPAPFWANTWHLISGEGYVAPILSVASIVGFVTVIGFAIRSGMIMLRRYIDLSAAGVTPIDAIREGSLERVVPIIMTSLTTILGLIPLIIAINKPGGELLGPLAIVQFGGLISATLLNLLILPAAASMLHKRTK